MKNGLCNRHYLAARSTRPKRSSVFQSSVVEHIERMVPDECYFAWDGPRHPRGNRPQISRPFGRKVRPFTINLTRYAWFVATGAFPEKQLNHACGDSRCWNLYHLYEGSAKQNTQDAIRAGTLDMHVIGALGAAVRWGHAMPAGTTV